MSFPACQQLTHRIEQLLSNKNTHYYMKSITCIQAFREQSVKVNKHSLFSLWDGDGGDVGVSVIIRVKIILRYQSTYFWLKHRDYEST